MEEKENRYKKGRADVFGSVFFVQKKESRVDSLIDGRKNARVWYTRALLAVSYDLFTPSAEAL